MMAAILIVVLVYIRIAGTEAFMGAEEEAALVRALAWPGCAARLRIYAGLAVAYMLIPIAVIASSPSARPRGEAQLHLRRLHDRVLAHAFSLTDLNEAMLTSPEAGGAGDGDLDRDRDADGDGPGPLPVLRPPHANLLIILPMASPEVVIGAALLSFFMIFSTLARLHDAVDRPRHVLHQLRRGRGEIATDRLRPQPRGGGEDLGATPLQTFRYVTLPLLAPGVLGAALLAFALSIDDFVISNFNSGTTVTFPLYVFGVALRGIPVQVNVIATMLFTVTVVAMALVIWQQRRAERMAAAARAGGGPPVTSPRPQPEAA